MNTPFKKIMKVSLITGLLLSMSAVAFANSSSPPPSFHKSPPPSSFVKGKRGKQGITACTKAHPGNKQAIQACVKTFNAEILACLKSEGVTKNSTDYKEIRQVCATQAEKNIVGSK